MKPQPKSPLFYCLSRGLPGVGVTVYFIFPYLLLPKGMAPDPTQFLIVASMVGFGGFLLYMERTLIDKGWRSYRWIKTKALVKGMRHESYLVNSILGMAATGVGLALQTDMNTK